MPARSLRGFTLVELLVSVLISMFIVITLYSAYGTLDRIQKSWLSIKEKSKHNRIFWDIQNQIYLCKDFKFLKGEDFWLLEYYTTEGYTSPFSKVRLRIYENRIVYEELKPNTEDVLYSQVIIANIKDVIYSKGIIKLKLENRTVELLVVESMEPAMPF
ncbi:MAG: prepilin-type N-terminal cleavage/methylation domain-containing protein [Aquificaceae bacterium]|nr:prepilin-type N-terminal cleavage/methylation domain-containing protein [Aquificaceae bacterium]